MAQAVWLVCSYRLYSQCLADWVSQIFLYVIITTVSGRVVEPKYCKAWLKINS